jgi:hypothetical protein
MDTQLAALAGLARLCRLVSVDPVVQCLPPAAAGEGSQKVQLKLQLTVPSRCRLLGWQPPCAPVSAEAQALVSLTKADPEVDVVVQVRCVCGAYLPVTLTPLSNSQLILFDNRDDTATVSVQVRRVCSIGAQQYSQTRMAGGPLSLSVDSALVSCLCLQAEVYVACGDVLDGFSVELWTKVSGPISTHPRSQHCSR